MFKNPAEYAAVLLDFTGGNRMEAVALLFEARTEFRLPQPYVADVFNILTGN
jgi:hypothetical protein